MERTTVWDMKAGEERPLNIYCKLHTTNEDQDKVADGVLLGLS